MEGRKGGSWLPFSSGPRLCIGYTFALLEMKVMPFTLQCLFPDTEGRRNTTAATAQFVYMDKRQACLGLSGHCGRYLFPCSLACMCHGWSLCIWSHEVELKMYVERLQAHDIPMLCIMCVASVLGQRAMHGVLELSAATTVSMLVIARQFEGYLPGVVLVSTNCLLIFPCCSLAKQADQIDVT